MGEVCELNNRVAELLGRGLLDEAERVLARTAAILSARPPAVVAGDDLEPVLDEYFFRVHSVDVLWRRGRKAEALPHAERASRLETELVAAARGRGLRGRELDGVAYSAGTWGWVSVLTELGRLEEAERAFQAYVEDEELYQARHRRHAQAAEQVLVAGLCLFWDSPERRQRGRALVARAERLGAPENPELAYGYACFWALLGELQPALHALELALRLGIEPARALADEDLRGLHGRPEFERLFPREPEPAPPPPPEAPEPPDWSAARERTLRDSRTQPDEGARARTRAFLGPDLRKARIRLARHTTYGLGGVALEVRGDGRVEIVKEAFGPHERAGKHALRLEPSEVQPLFMAFIDQAFTEMVVAGSVGHPDEIFIELRLTGARGRTHELGKFVTTEHLRFDALANRVRETIAARLDPADRKRLTL